MLCVDSWLGMFCEYNLISHASAFSIRPHPLKAVTLFAHSTYFNFSSTCQFFLTELQIYHSRYSIYAYQFIHTTTNKPDYNTIICIGYYMVFCFKCYNLPFLGGGMGMWTNTHCFDFQIFWAGGTTGMTYLYYIIYIIYIILFIQDHIYIYNILYTGLHILWCEHVSSRIAGSRLFFK